jgi:hypothetical protein
MSSQQSNILQRTLEEEEVKIIFTMKNNIFSKLGKKKSMWTDYPLY